jgi:hypothetical protein
MVSHLLKWPERLVEIKSIKYLIFAFPAIGNAMPVDDGEIKGRFPLAAFLAFHRLEGKI